jgi:hypothetical protein
LPDRSAQLSGVPRIGCLYESNRQVGLELDEELALRAVLLRLISSRMTSARAYLGRFVLMAERRRH